MISGSMLWITVFKMREDVKDNCVFRYIFQVQWFSCRALEVPHTNTRTHTHTHTHTRTDRQTHTHAHTHTPVNLASKPVNAPAIPPTKILKPAVNAYFLRGVRMFTLVRG